MLKKWACLNLTNDPSKTLKEKAKKEATNLANGESKRRLQNPLQVRKESAKIPKLSRISGRMLRKWLKTIAVVLVEIQIWLRS